MKADYDSEANALAIELVEVDRWDDGDEFDEDYCNRRLLQGSPRRTSGCSIQARTCSFLEAVAESYELDAGKLIAAAKAALAAPDRAVTIGDRVAV